MLDDLFHETGVDLVLYGHNHHYERMHPVYNKKVFGDKSKDIIRNPKASIHIVNGAGVSIIKFKLFIELKILFFEIGKSRRIKLIYAIKFTRLDLINKL